MLHVSHDLSLVMTSFVVTVIVCYFALSLEHLILKGLRKELERAILIFSGLVFGSAVWCMHFLGMLACHFPADYSFDFSLTILSFIIAFLASGFSIWLTTRPSASVSKLLLGAILMGLGISGMHYTGLLALSVEGYSLQYRTSWTFASVLVAILGSGFSFWLTFLYKKSMHYRTLLRALSALTMTVAIVGMHYISMAGVVFSEYSTTGIMGLKPSQEILLFVVILISLLILLAALCIAIMEQRLEERGRQLSELNHELANYNLHDGLTKLPNRLYLNKYANVLFGQNYERHQNFAFIYIDIDHFKRINEGFGHQIADQLLVQMTSRLLRHINKQDKLLHIGGDEFLVITENDSCQYAINLAEAILETLQTSFVISWKEVNITASIGIAMYPEHGNNLHDLLVNADTAMLNSKFYGRNTYTVFSYQLQQEQSKTQLQMINDLYKAVSEQQLRLYYQPKFLANGHQMCGVEALIRWQHPSLGLLMPGNFIESAEKTGVIISIGYWVLEHACQQIQAWEQQGLDFFPVAINLSAVQFDHQKLFPTLENLLKKYQIQPDHLMIEVTESAAINRLQMTIENFKRLREMGIQLAVDDFGTGYSNFLYLKDLPINEVKIDRGFILDLIENEKSEIILESIIQLTTKLGLIVTAEGVETLEQAQRLTRLGCIQLQGFLFARPMLASQLEVFELDRYLKRPS